MAHSHLGEGGRIHLKNKTIHLKHNTPFHATKGSPWKFQTEKQVLRGHLWLPMSYLTTLTLGQKFVHHFLRFYVLDTGPGSLVSRLAIFDGTKGNKHLPVLQTTLWNQGYCLEVPTYPIMTGTSISLKSSTLLLPLSLSQTPSYLRPHSCWSSYSNCKNLHLSYDTAWGSLPN